jgi:hypothetical protein
MHAGTVVGAMSLAMVLGACGDGDPASLPAEAEIAVSNRTSGDPIETEGYLVRLDGDDGHALPVGGSILLSGLEPGDHRLELADIPADCEVSGANPRVVPTQAALTSQSLFLVTCTVPGTGRVFVQTTTYGEAEGDYVVEVNGGPIHSIGTKDTLTLHALPGGPVTLRLARMGHCVVAGRNPRTIVVRVSQIVGSLFKVRCDLPPTEGPQLRARRADPPPR